MNNTPFDLNSFISEFSPPSSIAADVDTLCQNLEKMFAGQPADLTVFAAGLARVMKWATIRTPADGSSAAVGWRARYAGLPKMGGTLTCQNDEQELMLSMDSEDVVYTGSWRSLLPGQEEHGGIFSIEDTSSGRMLVLDTGLAKQQLQLPVTEGMIWGSIAGFLQGIQVDKPAQSEPPESQPAPASPGSEAQPNGADAKVSAASAPTILVSPAKRQNPAPAMPIHNAGANLSPAEQPDLVNPEGWQCACGRKNTGQFCPKCGMAQPSSAVVQSSTAAQPTYCKQCGTEISYGARFCRNCGAEAMK